MLAPVMASKRPIYQAVQGWLGVQSTAMWFGFAAIVFMMVGRKLGWLVSKAFLYPAPITLSLVGTVVWGVLVGFSMSALIGWLHPGSILKWVLGFALGAYVSIPNYGLFNQGSIPDFEQPRHLMISNVPLVSYVVTEFATQFMR